MREFGQIPTALWLREDLAFHAKALYAYLLSSPHANFLGCFLCREGYIVSDTGMSRAALRRGFEQLEAAGLALRLGACVYLPGQVGSQVPRNESVVASRLGVWRELPDGEARARVAADMLRFYDKLNGRQREELAACASALAPDTYAPPRADTHADTHADTNADINVDINVGIKTTDRREEIVRNTPHSPPPAPASPEPLGGRGVPVLAPVFPEPSRAPERGAPEGLVAAILVVTGNDPARATAPLLRAARQSVCAVLAVEPHLSAESLAAAGEAYRQKYRNCVLSPRALARNWSNLCSARSSGPSTRAPLDPYCAPPGKWREVLAGLYDLSSSALAEREWEDLGTDLRKEVLRELARPSQAEEVCGGR